MHLTTALLSGGGCLCPVASTFGKKLAAKQSYSPMASRPELSSLELPHQWNQAPVTLIYQWKNKAGGGGGGGRMAVEQ